MKKDNKDHIDATHLRHKAEQQLGKKPSLKKLPPNEADILKILHELEVHQEELKIQNAELLQSIANAEFARKKAELAERKYTNLFDFGPSGFLTLNANGEILDLNFVAAGMLGKERSRLIKSSLAFFIAEKSREDFYNYLQKVMASRTVVNYETVLISDHKQTLNVYIRGIVNPDGDGCLINLVDITQDKNAESLTRKNRELVIAKDKAEEINRLKSAFLQNMTHEIRTPLNAICGFSEQLNTPGLTDDKRKFFTDIIISSGKQLLSIVEDILTMSSLETGQESLLCENVNLNDLFIGLLAIFKQEATAKGIDISYSNQNPTSPLHIYTDRSKITQVLTNLIANAIKFTHTGGVEFGYQVVSGDNIKFFVKDTGIGIEQDKQAKIFERFIQANKNIQQHYGGNGLGLTISKGFIELMNGNIWVESKPNKGSVFYFTIPYQPSVNSVQKKTVTNTGLGKAGVRPTVLIAEDHDFNFMLLRELLSRMDCIVIRAMNGQDAVEICRNDDSIDLVLMDIRMPIMDGYTAAQQIKKIKPSLPLVAQTAVTSAQQAEDLSKAFDDYITKPLSREILTEKLNKYLFFE